MKVFGIKVESQAGPACVSIVSGPGSRQEEATVTGCLVESSASLPFVFLSQLADLFQTRIQGNKWQFSPKKG